MFLLSGAKTVHVATLVAGQRCRRLPQPAPAASRGRQVGSARGQPQSALRLKLSLPAGPRRLQLLHSAAAFTAGLLLVSSTP